MHFYARKTQALVFRGIEEAFSCGHGRKWLDVPITAV